MGESNLTQTSNATKTLPSSTPNASRSPSLLMKPIDHDNRDEEAQMGSSNHHPHLHTYSDPNHRSQNAFTAMLHIICITAGVGVLNLPRVVADSGWLTLVLFPIVAFITDYTSRMIVKCMYLIPELHPLQENENQSSESIGDSNSTTALVPSALDEVSGQNPTRQETSSSRSVDSASFFSLRYPASTQASTAILGPRVLEFSQVGYAAFGKPGYILVQIFYKIVMIGLCIVFLILAGSCVQQLFAPLVDFPEWQWILIITGLLAVPVVFLKSMKEVVWTSAIGFLATVVLVIVTVIVCLIEIQTERTNDSSVNVQYTLFDIGHLPLSLAGICFAYCGNYVYPDIEQVMTKPKKFGRTVSFSMILVTLMYLPVAILAYLVYGNDVKSPILKSFPPSGWVTALLIFITAHVLATLPLPMIQILMDAERKLGLTAPDTDSSEDSNLKNPKSLDSDESSPVRPESPKKNSLLKRIIKMNASALLRLAFLGSISLISCIFYQSFTDIMDFFGAISNSSFLFFFPIFFYVKLKGWRNIPWYEKIFHIFVVLLGIMTTVVGGYQAGRNLFTSFKAPFSQ